MHLEVTVTVLCGGEVNVKYIATHSGHDLSDKEMIHLPVPASTRQCIAQKLLNGIPIDRILDGMYEAISITSLIIIYTHDRYP